MICLTKLFQQKRRRIGYILAFSGPMISKRDSSEFRILDDSSLRQVQKLKELKKFKQLKKLKGS